MLFPDDRVHQIFGIALLVLWIVHVVLNRHWYYIFMSFHIGLHVGMIANKIIGTSSIMTLAGKIILTIVCVYGIYAFITRGAVEKIILSL